MSGWKDPEISALEVACDRFTQDNAILRKENTHLLSKIEQLRGDIVLTATEHDKTIDENAALRAENEELKKSIEEHNAKMDKVPSRSRPSTPSEGLQFLAEWFDAFYGDAGVNDAVQQDLRKWAKEIDALRAEVDTAKEEIEFLTSEHKLLLARLRYNPLPNDNMIHDESEVRRLYSDLAAAVDTIRRIATSYDVDAMAEARAFLKRMEVTP